jgi:hypothetical protein
MSEHPHCPDHVHQELSGLTVPARPVRVKRFARSEKCRVVPVLIGLDRLIAADRAKPAGRESAVGAARALAPSPTASMVTPVSRRTAMS